MADTSYTDLTDVQSQLQNKANEAGTSAVDLNTVVTQLQDSDYFNYYPVVKNCPGTEQYGDCQFLSTPQQGDNRQTTWSCPAGYYCMTPYQGPQQCMPGFYCPANTWQPLYCSSRYYCSNDTSVIYRCPKGFFCAMGSVDPVSCGQLDCPAGSPFPNSALLVVVLLALFFIVATLSFVLKDRYIDFHRLQQKKRLADASLNIKVKEQLAREEAEREQTANALISLGRSASITTHRRQKSSMSINLRASNMSLPVREIASDVDKLKAAGLASDVEVASDAAERQTFDISFENLSYVLPGGTKIIDNVTGRFFPGRVCAIMGPSGAGKTSLVSLILGKTRRSAGHIYINDKKEDLRRYNKIIGFVPQEDIMLRELTVESVLTHSAMARLPSELTSGERTDQVSNTIAFLELSHVFDSEIGDEENRGISGGQRKRVNIGMELVADPSILILDEPTSGLDSSTSLQVCTMLKQLAVAKNIVVISIIHSPSLHTYEQFDDLLLLGKGGHVVYHGPRALANKWFKRCGFPLPANENPADYFMDCICGKVPCKVDEFFTPKDFFALWDRHGHEFLLEQSAYYFPSHLMPNKSTTGASPTRKQRDNSPESLITTAASNRANSSALPESPVRKRAAFSSMLPHASSDSNLAEAASGSDTEGSDTTRHAGTNTSAISTPNSGHAGYRENRAWDEESRQHVLRTDVLSPMSDEASTADKSPQKLAKKKQFLAKLPNFDEFVAKANNIKEKSNAVAAKTMHTLGRKKFTRDLVAWIASNTIGTYNWCYSIFYEMFDTARRAYYLLLLKKDPVRTTPTVFYIYWLCVKRSFLQAFKNAKSFFLQLMFHMLMGMVVSVATQNFNYIGRQGESICQIAPAALQLSCRQPNDSLKFMGMLFSWGSMLGGITMALRTFGHEKSVFWREASVGLPLTPYFLAKLTVDLARITIASVLFSLAFILFFPFQSTYMTFFSASFMLYFVSTGIGYTISLLLNKAVAPLAGVGLSIAYALFFSGALSPSVYDLTDPTQSYSPYKIFWDISAPRWAVEAIWIRETANLHWFELHQNGNDALYGYKWDNFGTDMMNMYKIGATWLCMAFIFMKLLKRKNM